MIGAIGSVTVLTELGRRATTAARRSRGTAGTQNVRKLIHELQRRVKVIKLNVNGTYEISIEGAPNKNVAATFLTTIGVRHSPLNTVQILKKNISLSTTYDGSITINDVHDDQKGLFEVHCE